MSMNCMHYVTDRCYFEPDPDPEPDAYFFAALALCE
jgi:hypothetical protein